MDLINILKKKFSKKAFFLRIYEDEQNIIFWNDNDIFTKINTKKIKDILIDEKTINKFVDELIDDFLLKIRIKYDNFTNRIVSVIIPNYNNEIFVKKTIDSVLENTYKNIEIIFIDDCSTDKSLEIVEKNYGDNSKIKILKNEENMGVYYSINRGILHSTGYYIFKLDSDDFIKKDTFKEIIENLELKNRNRRDIWGYGTHFQRIRFEGNIDNVILEKKSNSYIYLYYRELLNYVGFYNDNRFGADSEFYKRCKIFGYKFFLDEDNIYYNAYTIAGKNLTQIHRYEERSQYFRKAVDIIKKKEYIKMAFIETMDLKKENNLLCK